MTFTRLHATVAFSLLASTLTVARPALAQTSSPPAISTSQPQLIAVACADPAADPATSSSSSSSSWVEAPAPQPPAAQADAGYKNSNHISPFSALGIQLKVGVAGPGIDLATPIAQRLNLRAGFSFFQYSGSYTIDGIVTSGELKLRSGTASLDIFPFGNAFRISPGLTFYNGNNLNAVASVPAGGQFELDDYNYTSDPTGVDPVHGTGSLTFGNRVAPSLTLGTGNMIPRKHDSHLSIPFEIGFQYIKDPQLNFALGGTACSTAEGQTGCESFSNDPTYQSNLAAENAEINSDIQPLRFYPILSIGVAWAFKFGH